MAYISNKNARHLLSLFLLTLCFFVENLNADCNMCSLDGKACVGATKFQRCTENKPSGTIYTCGADQVCDINGDCVVKDENVIKGCNECGECDHTKTFACTGTRTFALCLGTTEPTPIKGVCTDGLTCSVQYPQICGSVNEGVLSTCTEEDDWISTTTTTTTPSPINNPSAFCGYMGKEGRFPVGADEATTCHQYIHCYNKPNGWIGARYNCYGSLYFDDVTLSCGTNLPARCSARIQLLSLYDLRLN